MRMTGLVMVLLVAGCGNDTTSSTASVPPAPTPTPTPTPTPATMMVSVGAGAANAFSPQTVTINPGDTVQWNWAGGPHTVTSGAPGAADGNFCSNGGTQSAAACNSTAYAQNAGATYSHTFPTAGTFPYYCTVHGAMMTGTVIVAAAKASGGGGGGNDRAPRR